jgi:hypothetical protein
MHKSFNKEFEIHVIYADPTRTFGPREHVHLVSRLNDVRESKICCLWVEKLLKVVSAL